MDSFFQPTSLKLITSLKNLKLLPQEILEPAVLILSTLEISIVQAMLNLTPIKIQELF
jgi:hypothetical protein